MKSIKGKLYFVYALIFASLSLTIFSSYIAVDTSNQHLMLSELLAEQRLQVELVTNMTVNFSHLRLIDDDQYKVIQEKTLEDLEKFNEAVARVLDTFQSRQYFFNDKLQELKFEGEFEEVFVKAIDEAENNWNKAYQEMQVLANPDAVIDEQYQTNVDNFEMMNVMLISDVDLITRLCREEAERQRKISSVLQISTLILSSIIFIWLIYFVKKSIQDPIMSVRNVFKKMGSGDFDVTLNRDVDDEFNKLFDDFNRFIENKHVIGRP